MLRRVSADLVVTVALALIGALVALLPGVPGALRIPLVSPLVLVLPGYALTRALFVERTPAALELMLLCVGLSLACAVLGGLVLNALPGGLTTLDWAVLLCAITVVGCAATLIQRARAPELSIGGFARTSMWSGPPLGLRAGGLFVGAALAVVAAVWVARTPVPAIPEQGYTILWMLPATDSPDGVRLGVRNFEPSPVQYQLRVVSGDQVLQEFSINLQPVEEWQAEVTLASLGDAPVEADLYRADSPDTIYRRTVLRGGS
jgi:hypothetical protein